MIEIDEVQPAEAHMGEEDIVDDEPDARFRAVIVGVAAHAPDIEAGRTCILLKRGEVRYFSSIVADAEQPLIGHSVAGNCRSEEHTSELQSLMRISYAVFCLKKKNNT